MLCLRGRSSQMIRLIAVRGPWLLQAALCMISMQAYGMDRPPSSPYLSDVQQVGTWSENGRTGWVRIAVSTGGIEHVTSAVWLQWIEDAKSPDDEPKLVSTSEVLGIGGIASVSPLKIMRGRKNVFSFRASHAYASCSFVVQIELLEKQRVRSFITRDTTNLKESCRVKNGEIR
jgi:hypothetical protein